MYTHGRYKSPNHHTTNTALRKEMHGTDHVRKWDRDESKRNTRKKSQHFFMNHINLNLNSLIYEFFFF